jgi:hypothetical protein
MHRERPEVTKGSVMFGAPHEAALGGANQVRKGLALEMQMALEAERLAAIRRQPSPEEEAAMAKRRKRWDMGFW